MNSRAFRIAAVAVMILPCASARARGALLAVPGVVVERAPLALIPAPGANLSLPSAAAPLLPAAPLLSAGPSALLLPVSAAAPVAPPPAPAAAATTLGRLEQAAAGLGDAAAPGGTQKSAAALAGFWTGSSNEGDASFGRESAVDAIVIAGASPEFAARVKAHLKSNVPEPILRAMLADGYRIEINARVRQGREDLHEDNDYTGGFHSYGPKGKFIVIAEEIKQIKGGEWRKSTVWENAVNHEIGHAAAYILGEREAERLAPGDAKREGQAEWYATKGISESPEFRAAWRADYALIPDALKQERLADGTINSFYYFLHPDANGWYQRARQETFAEGFDIILRGEASKFNHERFMRHFPRALAEIRASLERAFGPRLDNVRRPPHTP
jgi:hypothetical protein